MTLPRCAILGCSQVIRDQGYCERHRKAIEAGDDPARLRQPRSYTDDKQCPAVAQYDGANCCCLIEGHVGDHENHFGSKHGTWGTAAQWMAISKGQYIDPHRTIRTAIKARVHEADYTASVTAPSAPLLPPSLRVKRKK